MSGMVKSGWTVCNPGSDQAAGRFAVRPRLLAHGRVLPCDGTSAEGISRICALAGGKCSDLCANDGRNYGVKRIRVRRQRRMHRHGDADHRRAAYPHPPFSRNDYRLHGRRGQHLRLSEQRRYHYRFPSRKRFFFYCGIRFDGRSGIQFSGRRAG